MKFCVLDKVKVSQTGQTGLIAFPYQTGEKIIVSLDGGKDREFFEHELELLIDQAVAQE